MAAKKKGKKPKRAAKKAPKRAKKKTPKRAAARRRPAAKKSTRRPAARPTKKNRPHRRAIGRWWEPCLASPGAGGVRMTASPNAAYWRMPARTRMRVVMRLHRSHRASDRRKAVALARAEQKHADAPPRRSNPSAGMSDGQAMAEYERTHWGRTGTQRVRVASAANPRFGTATVLGDLVSVTYRTKKGEDRELVDYEHAFEGPRPKLAYNDGGLVIAGGKYKVGREGIDG